jgi:hypothetical protein
MPIRFDKFVKSPLGVFEYTPEHIKELDLCSKDFWHFINYVKIVHPDRGRIKFEPYPFQKTILGEIKDSKYVILNLCRQCGKCLESLTKITIRNKKTGEIEEISISDLYEKFKKINA